METLTDKTREVRLRRMADRQGLILQKSRRRDPRALGYGCYQLTDARHNLVAGGSPWGGYSLTLDEIEDYLTSEGE